MPLSRLSNEVLLRLEDNDEISLQIFNNPLDGDDLALHLVIRQRHQAIHRDRGCAGVNGISNVDDSGAGGACRTGGAHCTVRADQIRSGRYILGTLPGLSGPAATVEDVLSANESVRNLLKTAVQNQLFLKAKMQGALGPSR